MVKVMICEKCRHEIYEYPCIHCNFIVKCNSKNRFERVFTINGHTRYLDHNTGKWIAKKKMQDILDKK